MVKKIAMVTRMKPLIRVNLKKREFNCVALVVVDKTTSFVVVLR
jgi:hypothetical protein